MKRGCTNTDIREKRVGLLGRPRPMSPSSYPALIGLDLPLTALIDVTGRKRKILTCTQSKQKHKKQKLERLCSIRLIRRDPKATNS
jgi:hypothetical protein